MGRILIIFIFFSSVAYSQTNISQLEKQVKNNKISPGLHQNAKVISLHAAIESALRQNYEAQTRKYEFQIHKNLFKDAYDDFYFPKINLKMTTNSDHFVENFYRHNQDNLQSDQTPNGRVGIEIEDYTLFNWGKDYLTYLNAKEDYQRFQQKQKAATRELRFQIIIDYFNLAKEYSLIQVYKKQLSHTSFIYRLAKEKLSLRKIKKQEFLQAKSLFLMAHKNYHQSLYSYYQIQEKLSQTLGDELKTVYRPTQFLKYKPITFNINESYHFVKTNNETILEAQSQMKNKERSYQKALKENLPLPKFSLKLGSYYRHFSTNEHTDRYETLSGSKNVELAASLNMSWRIYGSGGFFNSRKTETSFFNKKIAQINLKEAQRDAKLSHRMAHSKILRLEKQFEATKAELKNSKLLFDLTIDNYIANKTNFLNLKMVLDNLRESHISFENIKYLHLIEKVNLASIMGVDDFPGDKFDNLVEQ